MKKRIITISREFGSGGHTIGKTVAEELGIEFYDQELLEHIAEDREKRVIERYGENDKPIRKRIADKDSRRKTYYSHYTDRPWGMPQNYHLCLNSSALGEKSCVSIICSLFQESRNEDV